MKVVKVMCSAVNIVFLVFQFFSAQAGVLVMNGLSHEHTGQLGATVSGEVILKNPGNIPQDVRLYRRDYTFDATGASFFPEPGSLERSNADWVSLSSTYITLQPGEEMVVSYEVDIPANVEGAGTFWSVIIVEATDPVKEEKQAKGLQVNTVIRYAVQVATHIGDSGLKELSFLDYEVTVDSNQYFLTVRIENVGERLLIPTVSVEVYDQDGNVKGRLGEEKKKLYPGTSQFFTIPLTDISTGNYESVILADCGNEDLYGASVQLTLADG